ncbi:MAG TPA: sugar ABC transporter substrate-binding protein [Firmicutes bacterium]|jgi:ribose transport system substrate-binding protein|nr:sugar ABC transporter substrate-binding protein [Bacillota bacterium]
MVRRTLNLIILCFFFCAVYLINLPNLQAISGGVKVSPLSRKRPLVIAIVPKSLDNPVFVDAKETAELAARKQNVQLEWVAPFKVDPDAQVKVVEGLIWRKVDGIAISCSDPEKMRKVIARAVAANIKVATIDADCPDSKRIFYCGTDNYKAGYACGEAMVRIVAQKGLENQVLPTAILTGGITAHNLNERIRGFKEAAAGKIKLKYTATLACDDDTATGAKVVESYIKGHPETRAFYFSGGWAFFGPTESMPLYKKWCDNGGLAVSMDTFYPVIQAAQEGFAQVLVGQDFRKMGEYTVNYLVCAIKGLPVPNQYIDTGLEIADHSNFGQLLKQKKPWEMK